MPISYIYTHTQTRQAYQIHWHTTHIHTLNKIMHAKTGASNCKTIKLFHSDGIWHTHTQTLTKSIEKSFTFHTMCKCVWSFLEIIIIQFKSEAQQQQQQQKNWQIEIGFKTNKNYMRWDEIPGLFWIHDDRSHR